MLRKYLRLISWVLVLAACVWVIVKLESYHLEKGALGTGEKNEAAGMPKEWIERLADLANYKQIAVNDRFILYMESNTSSIAVKDKASDEIWTSASTISDEMLGGSQLLRESAKAPFNFSYADYDRPVHEVVKTNSFTMQPELESETIDNGVKINYSFPKIGIRFAIEYSLDNKGLDVFIPASEIKETGNNVLVGIEPLPNLGAASDEDDGYIFYPDGSGALSYFKRVHPQYKENYSAWVYGSEDVLKSVGQRAENAYLPVFGVHKNENGFVAFMTEGEYAAKINFSPSGYTANINRISGEFIYRRTYDAAIRRGEFATRIEKPIMATDRRVRYIFLPKGKADYSEMASEYRTYLADSGKIQKRIEQGAPIPAAIDLLMGVKEDRVLNDRDVKATTFRQAEQFIKEMKSAGIPSLSVILNGWTSDGDQVYPTNPSPAEWLGGKKDLQALNEYARKNDADVYLNFNNVDADSNQLGLKKNMQVMKAPSRLPIQNYYGDEFFLNAVTMLNKFNGGESDKIADLKPAGIDFDRYGQIALSDYNEWHPLSREGTVSKWLSMMEASRKQNGKVAVHGGNLYVLNIADRISDIPLGSTRYSFSDEEVPFYPMVVHGYIPFSGDQPINIHYDQQELFLKWIEYGSMPYYALTSENPEEFRYTADRKLFSSTFKQWSPILIGQVKELNDKLGFTWALRMTGHRKLSAGVFETTYEDGTNVIVNYNTDAFTQDGLTVEPMGYAVVKGKGAGA